jgi:hypothetical protein
VSQEKQFVGVRIPPDLRDKIKKLAIAEYCGNESMATRIILQKFFAKKVKQTKP